MTEIDARPLPLEGVRVLDFGQFLQGPYAGFLMAMAGAEVIKIEPIGGEPVRASPTYTYTFELLNTRKRGLALDLKAARGRGLAVALARKVDIVIENFAPGVMDRLGLGADVLLAANPRLVYATSTGYGLTGPKRDHVAMDATIQAVAGIPSATGAPDGPPMRAGLPIADILGGIHLYGAAMTALLDARRTGQGRIAEVSMLESLFPAQVGNLGLWWSAGGLPPPRLGNGHGVAGPHNVYRATDGWVAILCATDKQWQGLARAMEREALIDDPAYADKQGRVANAERLDAEVSDWTKRLTRDEVCTRCAAHRVPAAPLQDTADVIQDEHLLARGFLSPLDHPRLGPMTMANSAMRYAGSPLLPPTPAPLVGEDTADVLAEWLALDAAAIADLRQAGAIA